MTHRKLHWIDAWALALVLAWKTHRAGGKVIINGVEVTWTG